jgi:hypothetical protein
MSHLGGFRQKVSKEVFKTKIICIKSKKVLQDNIFVGKVLTQKQRE